MRSFNMRDLLFVSYLVLSLNMRGLSTQELDLCESLKRTITHQINDEIPRNETLKSLQEQVHSFEPLDLRNSYCGELLGNIKSKISSSEKGYELTSERIINHGILFEQFRLRTYLDSGVAPKRYFGFFDAQGDTANYEKTLRSVIIDAVRLVNDYAATEDLKIRITEKEIALTFLSEGGALLLTNPEHSANRVHPVRGIGLDDFRKGFGQYPVLLKSLDTFFDTRLQNLVVTIGSRSILLRPMTFREAILGTTLMYLFEKELASAKTRDEWGVELSSLPLDEQFITTSLVYNSGILFVKERVSQIKQFATAVYLDEISRKSKRPKLPLSSPNEMLLKLKTGDPIPRQLTSWSAVYHILQRYGAWVALDRFANIFKDGMFIQREIS